MKRKLQIFVSSTFTDLIAERQAAVSAILKSGHIPAGMELFTSGDKSQMDTIKKWIDESDVYMLILGGRYGSVEPKSGISYTELEYDYAMQQGKPLFAVVTTESSLESKVRTGGTTFLEKDNPQALKLFRAKVLSNISSFFDDEKDIRLSVHESLSDFASNRELKGWIQADEVVDTKPLFEEIKKLSEENQRLKQTLAEQEHKDISRRANRTDNFKETTGIMNSIKIKVPGKLNNGKETEASLLDLFLNNRETIINGVTNSARANDSEIFFYFNVCPKLQVYGFVENEKVAGVQYRRYAITKAGIDILAEHDRLKFQVYQQEKAADTPETVPGAPAPKRRTTTKRKATKPTPTQPQTPN